MAKPLLVTLESASYSFALRELERSDLYGVRKRVPTDSLGGTCTRAALTSDGKLVIGAGMSGQGYFDEAGCYVPRGRLVGIDGNGQVVESQPSTLGIEQTLIGPVDPSEVLNLELLSVYLLEPDQASGDLVQRLQAGEIFTCRFNYAASLEVERAYILANDQSLFALVGKQVEPAWVEEGLRFAPPVDVSEATDDLDFEMF